LNELRIHEGESCFRGEAGGGPCSTTVRLARINQQVVLHVRKSVAESVLKSMPPVLVFGGALRL